MLVSYEFSSNNNLNSFARKSQINILAFVNRRINKSVSVEEVKVCL